MAGKQRGEEFARASTSETTRTHTHAHHGSDKQRRRDPSGRRAHDFVVAPERPAPLAPERAARANDETQSDLGRGKLSEEGGRQRQRHPPRVVRRSSHSQGLGLSRPSGRRDPRNEAPGGARPPRLVLLLHDRVAGHLRRCLGLGPRRAAAEAEREQAVERRRTSKGAGLRPRDVGDGRQKALHWQGSQAGHAVNER